MYATWNGFDPAAMLISGIQGATDAGTYEVIFSPKQGYYWTDNGGNESRSAFWTIGRIVVEVPSQSNAPVYNGESQSPTWEGYQPDIMTLAGDTSGTGAGECAANFILDNNYQAMREKTPLSGRIPEVCGRRSLSLTLCVPGSSMW